MATTIRKHLEKDHGEMWRGVVITEKLKGWEELKAGCRPGLSEVGCNEREPFSVKGFLDHLVKWIAVDDQSINVVESEELRDLLLFVGSELKDGDIPHRTKLAQLLIERFRTETELLAHDTQEGHAGAKMGKVFMDVVKDYGITHKIGMMTMDNDSCNDTMMHYIEGEMWELGIPFDEVGNHVHDPIGSCRNLVTACRASDERRTDFQKTICEGNEKNMFDVQLAKNELLRECKTRWSSTMLMVDRTLELHPECQKELPQIAHIIAAAIRKIEEYVFKSRKSRIYVLAMIINPMMKLDWIEKHWTDDEAIQAREWVKAAMLEFCQSLCKSLLSCQSTPVAVSAPLCAASQSQVCGIHNILALSKTLSQSSLTSNLSDDGRLDGRMELSEAEKEIVKGAADERDRLAVEQELNKYIESLPVQGLEEAQDLDLIAWWQILQILKYTFCHEKLDFLVDYHVDTPDELAKNPEPSREQIQELLVQGQLDKLVQILNDTVPEL
ncbi:hypothetical protein JAAARDRAFT_50161 [Jaapia argillacea MUCL 33604]|uniref:hAT-like transposase RNase-H fold domain-containing protein n=1 Tax=Jaapia argillacea MUCL 33604 TaxID=933084 RepID=A0A067PR21_9AGAM|nr:hypothetical protein JAAARDRAFT_50161 [Jaapia argillacea MUCL 33604]